MKSVLFYISGHGFGHATRTIEVINQLQARAPHVLPIINTPVPEWLFRRQIAGNFEYVPCENDIGAVQKNWWSVDKFESLRRYGRFIEKEPEFLRAQVDFVKQHNVLAIVSDIPATAFVVASKAGVPGFGITNFSWDWIYGPYVEEYPQYRFVVEHIREGYSLASCLLRLPFYGDTSAFPVISDIPLVARLSTLKREEVLRRLNLDGDRKIVLLYLSHFDHSSILSDETRQRKDYVFVRSDKLNLHGLSFQDLVKAADAVVTKPGYGIVSDCIANRTPILYTSRDDFLEYHALVDGIKRYAHGHFVAREDLLGGRWVRHLDALLSTEHRWPQVATNGAEVAARKILQAM